jgi:hypothetical protein
MAQNVFNSTQRIHEEREINVAGGDLSVTEMVRRALLLYNGTSRDVR